MDNINKVLKEILRDKNIDLDAEYEKLKNNAMNDPEVQDFIALHQAQLKPDAIEKSAANIYEFVKQRDKFLETDQTTIQGFQPNLIISNGLIDVAYSKTAKTLAKEAAEKNAKMDLIDLPASLKSASLIDYDRTNERADALTKAVATTVAVKEKQPTKGLYLSGDFGVGKTYLLAGVATELTKLNQNVILVHMPTFIADLAKSFKENTTSSMIDKMKEVDVLMLDDIGAENLSQWSRDDVLGVILQYRMENQLLTYFSSNFKMRDLEPHFVETKTGIEPVKAKRLMERIYALSEEVVVGGQNRRHQ